MARRLREESHLQSPESENWSEWILAIVPEANDNNRRGLQKRQRGQPGYKTSRVETYLGEIGEVCGIYEWRASRLPRHGQAIHKVVYVGSTCPRQGNFPRLRSRILDYCIHGNHKKELINDALNRGYELSVRYKEAANVEEATGLENELLKKYNYAWNIRNNAIREVLPE